MIRPGQHYRRTERSHRGRRVIDRVREIEVLDVEKKQIGAHAKVFDLTTQRASYIYAWKIEAEWTLVQNG